MSDPVSPDTRTPDDGPPAGEKREEFFNTMIGTLCETIENVVGIEDAETFIGIVGRRMGQSGKAKMPEGEAPLPANVAEHLKQFKASIGGDFVVESIDGSRITFTNAKCPFAGQASGRPSLCMMTTNVFGRVAADATGYARVNVTEALARGDSRCRVIVNLEWDGSGDGQEFYG